MSYQKIIKDIRKGDTLPVYLLHGPEPFFIDEITKVVEKEVLEEDQKAFNLSVFYGKDTDYKTVRDAAMRFPMMAPKQVVILKEAQDMRSLAKLVDYVKNPAPTTLLLICHKHKKQDMRTAFGKAAKKNGLVFESKSLYDNELPGWVRNRISDMGYEADTKTLDLLVEHLGNDLSKIANELEKLAINVPKGTKLTPQHIQDNIGISKDYNVFELQEALGLRNREKTLRIAKYFTTNTKKHPLAVTLASLYGFFSKLYVATAHARSSDLELAKAMGIKFRNPNKAQYAAKFRMKKYRSALRHYSRNQVERVFSLLHEYDLRYKGVGDGGTAEGELLRELVLRILAV